MRKRLEELASGRFENKEPILEFSVQRIELEVFEGSDETGEFVITSKNHVPLRGLIYSSSSRMECLTPRFEGEEVKIQYQFHSEGLIEGDIQKGEFFFVCNQCEYILSFVAVVSKRYADFGEGTIRGLPDFADLAQNQWGEAKRIFYSPCFSNIIKRQEVTEQLLYNGIAKGAPTDRNLEEFLLAAKKKTRVTVEVAESEFICYNVKEVIRLSTTLEKNTWGYVGLEVSSDAPFLVPEKTKITTEDFLGSRAELGFYLYPQKMHGGKNFGSITLKDIHQRIVIRVCATEEKEGSKRDASRRKVKALHAKLLNLYVEYRLKKIVTGKWATQSCACLEELIDCRPENMWYRLLKAQAFLINGQRQEAEWLLSEFKRKCKDRKSPEWAYYMYICTLMEHEELYVDRLTEEIEQIYLENRDNTMLFWCLLFLREDYATNRYQKLKALEARIQEGNESPLFYVEAYCLYCQEPFLVNRLGDFELKILNWARKQKMLTEALAEQVFSVFPERLVYQRRTLLLLESCYEQWGNEEMLLNICSYLIKNQKYGRRFFPWYEKGVEAKLRITGLYEAYLMSMDSRSIQEVPKIILMYFKYNNQLDYRQKAILYVNIIANREKQPEVYEQYRQSMEQFAYEQMELKHMDDNLAVIYEEVVSKGIYSEQLSDVLADVLFVHKLICFEPDAVRVIITQKQLENPQVVPLINGVAYFPLYSNDYCIFIEDCHGNRYSGSISCQMEKLMYPGRYLRACMQYSPDKLSYLLYYFSNREAQEVFEEKDLKYFKTVMESDVVSLAYKAMLAPKMFRLLQKLERRTDMEKELDRLDFAMVMPKERGCIQEICIDHGLYDRAYQIAADYGWEMISPSGRVRLLTYQIEKMEFAEEENLLQYTADTYLSGKFNDVMLEYLSAYYQGPTKTMTNIWKHAKEYEIVTRALEERILTQMLYTTEYVDCVAEIYQSYEVGGDKKIKAAYLTWFSYCGFVKNMIPPENLMEELRSWRREQPEMNTVCELTLLKYYAEHPAVLETDEETAEELLQKYLLQGMYFAFYQKLSPRLIMKYQLYDKYFIEYHSGESNRVQIHYKMGDMEQDYVTEDMTEMYEGIFVKVVILFFGDSMQYYISEEIAGQQEVTQSDLITCNDMYGGDKSRYHLLNEIRLAQAMEDQRQLEEKMKHYRQLEGQVEQMFTIL